MPELGPWIGKEHERAPEGRIGERPKHQASVVHRHAYILDGGRFDQREEPRDSVHERLDADEADLGMPLGERREVLAAAEADLEPDRAYPRREQADRIEAAFFRQSEGQ